MLRASSRARGLHSKEPKAVGGAVLVCDLPGGPDHCETPLREDTEETEFD